MEVRVRVPEKQKKAVRTIMKELFNVTPTAEDEDTMMSEFRRYCERTITSIDRLEPRYQLYAYPGRQVLAEGKKLMSSLLQIKLRWNFSRKSATGRTSCWILARILSRCKNSSAPTASRSRSSAVHWICWLLR